MQAFVDPPAPGVVGFFAGEAKLTIEGLTFAGGKHVDAVDTPDGMADRIAPRIRTSDAFTL